MRKLVAVTILLCGGTAAAYAAGPTSSTMISAEDVQKVLKAGPKETDHTIRVIDMGQNYNMAIGVVQRGATGAPRPAGAPQQANTQPACGLASAPAGAKSVKAGAISHDSTAETYYVIAGGGTLITGGQIVGGRRSAPDSSVTTTLNGPSCSGGTVAGNFVATQMKVGDIAVIPAGVPHGWSNIPSGVTYLSVRPDPQHVLPKAGFVYPALKK